MSTSPFSAFVSDVKKGAKALGKDLFKEFQKQATKDAKAFLDASKANLRKWTRQLADGDMSKREFQDLVKGEKDLAKLHALTEAGIATARLERFRSGLITLVIDSAFGRFL